MMKDSNIRSISKGISWRLVASLDTFILGWIIFGNPWHASQVAGLELATKIILYFLHERLWNIIRLGRRKNGKVAPWRSLVKSISYRFFGSLDTTFLSYIITGKIWSSVTLSGFEVLTKVALYYLHERVWSNIKWGRIYTETTEAVKN